MRSGDCHLQCVFVACYSIGVRVKYIHRTEVSCRNIFMFILCIILDSSNTVYILRNVIPVVRVKLIYVESSQ